MGLKDWLLSNWSLKIASVLVAALLWIAFSNQTSSEIGLDVPLEYRNIPPQLEITGDTTNMVEVRLRGSANVIKGITVRDVSTIIDVSNMKPGPKIVALSQENVQAPFGAEVVRVTPATVRFNVERTVTKTVAIDPVVSGQPADGYEAAAISVEPRSVEIEGPESSVASVSSISTVPIRLDGARTNIEQSTDLDIVYEDIRLRRPGPVHVKVEIQAKP